MGGPSLKKKEKEREEEEGQDQQSGKRAIDRRIRLATYKPSSLEIKEG